MNKKNKNSIPKIWYSKYNEKDISFDFIQVPFNICFNIKKPIIYLQVRTSYFVFKSKILKKNCFFFIFCYYYRNQKNIALFIFTKNINFLWENQLFSKILHFSVQYLNTLCALVMELFSTLFIGPLGNNKHFTKWIRTHNSY